MRGRIVIPIVTMVLIMLLMVLFSLHQALPDDPFHAERTPIIIATLVSALLSILGLCSLYWIDSLEIRATCKRIKKEFGGKSHMNSPSVGGMISLTLLYFAHQYGSFMINKYWGLLVQLFLFIFLLARRAENREKNVRHIHDSVKGLGSKTLETYVRVFYGYKFTAWSASIIVWSMAMSFIKLFLVPEGQDEKQVFFVLLAFSILFILLLVVANLALFLPYYFYNKKGIYRS